jgi:hypothetical protein
MEDSDSQGHEILSRCKTDEMSGEEGWPSRACH